MPFPMTVDVCKSLGYPTTEYFPFKKRELAGLC